MTAWLCRNITFFFFKLGGKIKDNLMFFHGSVRFLSVRVSGTHMHGHAYIIYRFLVLRYILFLYLKRSTTELQHHPCLPLSHRSPSACRVSRPTPAAPFTLGSCPSNTVLPTTLCHLMYILEDGQVHLESLAPAIPRRSLLAPIPLITVLTLTSWSSMQPGECTMPYTSSLVSR